MTCLARATFVLPTELELVELAPAKVENTVPTISRRLTLYGDRSDPRTALVMSGRFRTRNPGLFFQFHAESSDFGGSSGRPNQTFMAVDNSIEFE